MPERLTDAERAWLGLYYAADELLQSMAALAMEPGVSGADTRARSRRAHEMLSDAVEQATEAFLALRDPHVVTRPEGWAIVKTLVQ